ncbi:ROK family protein [Zongyangia hominis]|uniref:ROK family protein n=1 Tax=Zongyangia hominis TaxID=2763677 RepID=A0A926EDC6_9FIRM|nr:ROK family protein [Zongyangia hominis]MBC8569682.1 ROK family protein [Zongyangia hominis]
MGKDRGENNRHLKYRNRGLVLKLICTGDGVTRIDLSHITGLTKMTVTNITSELIQQGYVVEGSQGQNSNVGRNPIILDLSPNAPKVLGIQVARSHCSAILTDLKMHTLQKKTIPFSREETKDSLMEKVFSLTDEMTTWENNIIACGVSTVGPLDVKEKMILNPPDFFGISDLPIGDILSSRYCMDVFIDNDMNGSALAEKLFGNGRDYANFLYVGIDNGIGSGIISDNVLYQDNSGLVGEFGHVVINFNGDTCICGNRGCLETYASLPVVERKLRAVTGKDLDFIAFCQLHEDPLVDAVLSDMVDKISCALVNVVNMLNPSAVFIGHFGSFLPDKYLTRMEEWVNAHKLSGSYQTVKVRRSHFEQDAPLMGSVCIVLNRLFNGKLLARLDP